MMKVAQCWDDGTATDARIVEILRKYKAKATFNLCPGVMEEKRIVPFWNSFSEEKNWSNKGFHCGRIGINELIDVYGDFQVASHCWKHESVGREANEIFFQAAMDARKFLEDIFQRECPGFAWPNGTHSPETERMLSNAGFRYGRTVENVNDVTLCDDPMHLAPTCHFMDGNFLQKYQNAKKTGVFYFWGHSYEMFEYDMFWKRYEEMIKFITEDTEAEWVDVIDLVPLCKGTGITNNVVTKKFAFI